MRNPKKILLFSFLILFSIAAHAQVYDTVEGKKYFDKAQKLSGSYSKQAKLYSKASDLGYVAANAPLDNIYQWGYGVDRDFSKRILYMKRSAEAGDTKAMLTVAGIYLGDEIYSYPLKNTDSAIHWYEKAAKSGNIDAMKKLSFIYSNWDEAFRNPLRAKLWEAEAADAGDPAAIVKRALATKSPAELYEAGMKLRQSDDVHMQYAGEELLEESGKRGYGKSFYELAQINRFISGKEDLVLIYYQMAAEQWLCRSSFRFGTRRSFSNCAFRKWKENITRSPAGTGKNYTLKFKRHCRSK